MTVPSCDYNSYPLAPTFCDDWCRATLRADCKDDRPEACVGNCERGFSLDHCAEELRALARCYAEASDSEFSCSPVGTSTAKPDTCARSRDVWLACEAPDVHACVQFCRPLYDPGIEYLTEECPELVPSLTCEDLCWTGVRLDAKAAEPVVRCFVDVLTRCQPVSRSASQSLREYCEDAVLAGRYTGSGGAAGAGGGGPM